MLLDMQPVLRLAAQDSTACRTAQERRMLSAAAAAGCVQYLIGLCRDKDYQLQNVFVLLTGVWTDDCSLLVLTVHSSLLTAPPHPLGPHATLPLPSHTSFNSHA